MTKLADIAPQGKTTVMKLVSSLGVDVSDWKNFKKGKEFAPSNPKYCYEWSFVQPKKIVVLNLWLDAMKEENNRIQWSDNMREWVSSVTGPQKRRASKMEEAVQTAIKDKLPIRVIICVRKKLSDRTVSKRGLDLVSWTARYDKRTGQCTLTRGASAKNHFEIESENAVDDLSNVPKGNNFPDRAKVVAHAIKRDNGVRQYVLKRAKGKCEHCGERGFSTMNGRFYVETHHIIALCDSGCDTVDNVIALCPQHHRQAHYGIDAESLEAEFVAKLVVLNRR